MNGHETDATADTARYRALARPAGAHFIDVLDQRALPHVGEDASHRGCRGGGDGDPRHVVRGAPLIGAVGAYGLALALDADPSDDSARPRARAARCDASHGRQFALGARSRSQPRRAPGAGSARGRRVARSRCDPCDEDVAINLALGRHGLGVAARRRARSRSTDQCDDALQRRCARDLRLRDGDGADLPRACRRACRCTSGSARRGRGCRARA